MSVFEHNHRARIYNPGQHPYKHSVSEFAYAHASLPGVSTLQGVIDWFVAVLYPQTQSSVATVADLPTVGNAINDYRVVLDDGDGNAAAYRWEQREGDVSAQWYKVYDMDWGEDSILANFLLKTQDVYVYRYGLDDRDADGNLLTGVNSGQHIYGGSSANTHLTLHANSGDGTGGQTGYVQFGDHNRPISDNSLDSGTSDLKYRTGYFGTSVLAGTMTVASGSITDSSGAISFGNENLTTTGYLSADTVRIGDGLVGTPSLTLAGDTTTGIYKYAAGSLSMSLSGVESGRWTSNGYLTLAGAAATPSYSFLADSNTGIYSLGADQIGFATGGTVKAALDSSGFLGVGKTASLAAMVDISAGNNAGIAVECNLTANLIQFTQSSVLKWYVDASTNLWSTGGIFAKDGTVGNVSFGFRDDFNTGMWSPANDTIAFSTNGAERLRVISTGLVGIGKTPTTYTLEVNGSFQADNIVIGAVANTIASSNTDGDIIFEPNGTGQVQIGSLAYPVSDASFDLGKTTNRFQSLYMSGSIGDGTTTITSATLQSLRDINSGVSAGMTIFWDGSKWAASAPDTEVDHGTISGLSDDDHTQYALLAGRATGQALSGGTAASENLTLDSTAHATKGKILISSTLAATADASYSGSWSGVDMGGSSNRLRHVYTAGEFFGLRIENIAGDATPAASAVGRLWWNTSSAYVGLDNGSSVVRVSLFRYEEDTSWNGSDTSKNVTVSGIDATKAIWQLKDNSNDYEVIYCTLKATATTTVRIEVGTALPAGSYRLIGIQ